MQGFISHWNGISISDKCKYPLHLVKNFIRVKFPYITMSSFMNYVTTFIIFIFHNNIFLTNKTNMFLEKPAKV